MEITSRKENNTMIVSVQGRIDAVTAPAYESGMKELLEKETLFILDFEKLEYISSAGLRVILATAKSLKAKSGKMVMANVTGTVREVFDISGFGAIFTMYDSIEAALAGME
ncbi:stage II sporulation protein AA (anti-sigma F factor antagonist) [Desulfobotulus alkaliphilus]|uniref:Anti-sigma factor antagonist n=1 Tax=Desulfobotulus alkaliphilus TaxID=622671 RepID=A0A562RXJ2_9BACT|nr:STAS domain-containing protein [Desulfobotulus alkaliphilus]TWI73060.1 stage II sporulation protein AA (anti-sigma F factor antagonist) [Desulfobotulus alkaliphilus]